MFTGATRITRSVGIVLVVALAAGALGLLSLFVRRGQNQERTGGQGSFSVSAMSELPATGVPPEGVFELVERGALVTHGDSAQAKNSLRALRGPVGTDKGTLYVYSPREGVLCMIHWRRTGTCSASSQSVLPGVLLSFSPGGPGYAQQPDDLPPAIAAVVSDAVRSVEVITAAGGTTVGVVNNSVYFEPRMPRPDETWKLAVRVEYDDGTSAVEEIPDPRVAKVAND